MVKTTLRNAGIRTLFLIALSFPFIAIPAKAANSYVTADGVKRMKAADIDSEVIALLVAQQTCSVSPDLIIELKDAGADANTLKEVILADRYKQRKPARLSAEEIDVLKKAGCPDEMILRLFGEGEITSVVDSEGNESVLYRTDTLNPSRGRTAHQAPDTYNIYIEKLQKD